MINGLFTPRDRSTDRIRALWKRASHGARRSFAFWLAGCCLVCGLSQTLLAQSGDAVINREYPLKALFLYNFGSYVEWPAAAFASDEDPFVIGILGNAPLDGTLREIAATKRVAGRRIAIKQFTSVEAIERCQILFVARNVSPSQQEQVIERLRGLPVLTVGDIGGFAARSGCVNFYIESNKIRFEINLEAAKQQQLRISAKLLALAKIVQ